MGINTRFRDLIENSRWSLTKGKKHRNYSGRKTD